MQLVPIELTRQNISGIAGSISIACWVVVFVPQIYENFVRKSSEGLSLLFIVLWLAGDVFNLLGSVLQHLLPTMIILAAYYTVADIVLWMQCLWYTDEESKVDPIHLSPANPITEEVLEDVFSEHRPILISGEPADESFVIDEEALAVPAAIDEVLLEGLPETRRGSRMSRSSRSSRRSAEQPLLMGGDVEELREVKRIQKGNYIRDVFIAMCVVLGGFLSWYISYSHNYIRNGSRFTPGKPETPNSGLQFNLLAQLFGYLSALLYLGSRVPQILLNFKRKSCQGISFLFFLFACLGNITYTTSILVVSLAPKYLLLNGSWLLGSVGTLFMDLIIFIQFFVYGGSKVVDQEYEESD